MKEIDNDDEQDLFTKEMDKIGITKKNNDCIKKLIDDKLLNCNYNSYPKKTYEKRRIDAQEQPTQSHLFYLSEFSIESIDAVQEVQYNLCSLTKKQKRKLQFYKYSSDCKIDLHGYIIEAARNKLCHFIEESLANNIKNIHIIHGMSTSSVNNKNTLKSHCVHWLKQIPEVIAFCSQYSQYKNIFKINFGALNILLK